MYRLVKTSRNIYKVILYSYFMSSSHVNALRARITRNTQVRSRVCFAHHSLASFVLPLSTRVVNKAEAMKGHVEVLELIMDCKQMTRYCGIQLTVWGYVDTCAAAGSLLL